MQVVLKKLMNASIDIILEFLSCVCCFYELKPKSASTEWNSFDLLMYIRFSDAQLFNMPLHRIQQVVSHVMVSKDYASKGTNLGIHATTIFWRREGICS